MAGLKINICFWYLDSDLIEEILATLRSGNYNPEHRSARDIKEVKKNLQNGTTDLIIADFDLPDTLRNDIEHVHRGVNEDVPLIYVVGEKNELRAAETLKKGVWDYILKSQFTKLISTVYSSQKYGKVLRDSKIVLKEKQIQDELSKVLIQYTLDSVFIINEDWDILFANSGAAAFLNLPEEYPDETLDNIKASVIDLNGKPHLEIIKLVNRESELTTQQHYIGYIMPDKSISYGFLKIQNVDTEESKEQLTIITFQDMTDLRKVEQELFESESKYHSIFNAVQDGMLLIDPDTFEIVENNPRVEEMFGFDKKKSKQQNLKNLTVRGFGYDRDSLSKAVNILSGKDPVSYIYLSKRLNGKEFWTENTLTRFSVGEKNLIVLVIRDIHEQKLLEYNLKESREHFQNLAENSPDVIMRFDKDLKHLYVNQTIEDQTGLKVEQFINKTHAEVGIFPHDKVEFWEKALDQVFETGEANTVEFVLEGNDTMLSIEWRIYPERNENGEIDTVLTIARDVTAKQNAAATIKNSEHRLQLALQATSLGLWDWNLTSNEVYYSPVWFTMLGYESDELPQELETWQKLLHDDDRDETVELVNRSIKDRDETFETEFRLLSKDGSYKWIHAKGKAVQFDKEGNTTRLTGTHEDYSERKRNENIQKTLFNISNAVNTTNNLQELYEKIREYLGLVVDTTNCFLAIYHKDTNTLTLPFLRDEKDSFEEFPAGKSLTGYVISTGKAQLIDRKREAELTKKGLIEPVGAPSVSWLGVPLKLENKTIGVFAIQSYNEDVFYTIEDVVLLEFVSDQIAIAIERKRDQDSIRENQEKQRRIFESSPDPIIVLDQNAIVIDYNSALLEELHIKDQPIVGQNVFHFISREYWRKGLNSFKKTWEEGYIKNLEFQVIRADGSKFDAEVATGAMYNKDDVPESMVVVIKNISERKVAERNLMEAKEKAEESDRLKTAFLSNMSHEIRTPMNAIVGFSDLLNDATVSEDDRREFISQINLGADNLMHLIDDIIDISKIEAGQININKRECIVNKLVKDQIVMFRQNLDRLDKSQIDVRLNWLWPSESLVIKTDPFRLKQVITNLLSNAIKFTENGFVELGVAKRKDKVFFYVKDSGIGIREEKQSIIFDRFRQAYDSKIKLYGGTGLGLAISRNIILLLGGEIGVISESGRGSEFWFTIPADELAIKEQEISPDSTVYSKDWKGKKILVAEDDLSNYLLISESLKSTNVEILWAKDGEEALNIFKKQADILHLVLMDIHMPLLNGYDCTRAMKKIKPDLPIIAQTAYAMSGERELSLSAGCDDYISKPLQIKALVRMVESYIK